MEFADIVIGATFSKGIAKSGVKIQVPIKKAGITGNGMLLRVKVSPDDRGPHRHSDGRR